MKFEKRTKTVELFSKPGSAAPSVLCPGGK